MLIGTMSLKNSFIYMQFHPVAYIVKLNIEMTMADLIIKIVRSSARDNSYSHSHSYGAGNLSGIASTTPRVAMHRRKHSRRGSGTINVQGHRGHGGHVGMNRPLSQNMAPQPTSTPPEFPDTIKEFDHDKPYGSEFSSTVDIEANPRADLTQLHPRSGIMKTVATVISSPSAMGGDAGDWFEGDEEKQPETRP
jgi:hypothetical protein